MSKPAMGAIVQYGGHRGTFIADIWQLGDVNIIHASREVSGETLDRDKYTFDNATHHLSDFPKAGFWKPRIGVFVVPSDQVTELK